MTAASPDIREAVAVSIPLDTGWEMASTTAPESPATLSGLQFIPAQVPGTVASALREQKAWRFGDNVRFDASEYWFRCRFDAEPIAPGERVVLRIGGIATVAEVWLNGEEILKSSSMFASHEVDVSAVVRERNELLIVCRSLAAAMRERRRQPPVANARRRRATVALVPHDPAGPSARLRPRAATRRALASGDAPAPPSGRARKLVASSGRGP